MSFGINENYLKLPGSYLFSTIAKKVEKYKSEHPDADIIRLGIGDVTQPLCPSVIDALHKAVDEMGKAETFHGYAPDGGYEFLRHAMAENDYRSRGLDIADDEIFISDGAKSDSAAIEEIFAKDAVIAVCDPVYPVYVDSNAMSGRAGDYLPDKSAWSRVIYMPCTAEHNFAPQIPYGEKPDMIYLCFPNNPTGEVITKDELQKWVDYAVEIGAVIIYDAAYEAYIDDSIPGIPHSIYECDGARSCAIELRSFSKNAGFTGLRLGALVLPKDLVCKKDGIGNGTSLHSLWARRHGTRYNGAPYIVQRAGEACYSAEGKAEIKEQIAYYMKNAAYIRQGLIDAGFEVYGGVHSPYIWLRTPGNMTSWEFFDTLLEKAQIVGTPGAGFGPSGEHYFRLTAFGSYENTVRAIDRIKELKAELL
ncbi:LL-diaminopimelate aminotransferase [Butyrivibrio sp. MC2013]|uniref:LL-diaminopimelate aminotransferase n=1 Tax=Butyrivibrio sp. MC2013 TaxID=1280686 RepID=UPI000415A147|nr:LL-diaminopimelate aminotransferase [Butyrivibrio sp. MC2013]